MDFLVSLGQRGLRVEASRLMSYHAMFYLLRVRLNDWLLTIRVPCLLIRCVGSPVLRFRQRQYLHENTSLEIWLRIIFHFSA